MRWLIHDQVDLVREARVEVVSDHGADPPAQIQRARQMRAPGVAALFVEPEEIEPVLDGTDPGGAARRRVRREVLDRACALERDTVELLGPAAARWGHEPYRSLAGLPSQRISSHALGPSPPGVISACVGAAP